MAYGHRRYKGPIAQAFGYKRGMTTILNEDGTAVGVTLIELAPMTVTQVKSPETDGYSAVQIGLEPTASHRLTKAELGHLQSKNSGDMPAFRLLKELRDPANIVPLGETLPTEQFAAGTLIDVQSVSKGKGFAGAVKRYHFKGQHRTHGVSQVHRKPMTGGATDAARTMPGVKRPGHMGHENVTVRNLRIVGRDDELNLVAVAGAVPGPTGALVKMSYKGEFVAKKVAALGTRVGQQKQKKKK